MTYFTLVYAAQLWLMHMSGYCDLKIIVSIDSARLEPFWLSDTLQDAFHNGEFGYRRFLPHRTIRLVDSNDAGCNNVESVGFIRTAGKFSPELQRWVMQGATTLTICSFFD